MRQGSLSLNGQLVIEMIEFELRQLTLKITEGNVFKD